MINHNIIEISNESAITRKDPDEISHGDVCDNPQKCKTDDNLPTTAEGSPLTVTGFQSVSH